MIKELSLDRPQSAVNIGLRVQLSFNQVTIRRIESPVCVRTLEVTALSISTCKWISRPTRQKLFILLSRQTSHLGNHRKAENKEKAIINAMKKLGALFLLILICLVPLTHVNGIPQNPSQNFVIVSTPQADGAIYHQVVDGDTLIDIAAAYGMSPSDIMTLNGNSPDATEIYIGQFLLIRRGTIATATLESVPTIAPHTPQPTVVQPTRTAIPTKTPLPSPTATPPPSRTQLMFGDSYRIGLTLITISAIGIALVVIFGFLRKSK